jgi:hypothetical protein
MNKVVLLSALMLIGTGVVIGSEDGGNLERERERIEPLVVSSEVIRGAEVIERGVGSIDSYVGDMQRRVSVLQEMVERQARVESELCRLMRKLGKRVDGLESAVGRNTDGGDTLSLHGRFTSLETQLTQAQLGDDIAKQFTLTDLTAQVGSGDDAATEPTVQGRLTKLAVQVGTDVDTAEETTVQGRLTKLAVQVGTDADAATETTVQGRLEALAAQIGDGTDGEGGDTLSLHDRFTSLETKLAQTQLGDDIAKQQTLTDLAEVVGTDTDTATETTVQGRLAALVGAVGTDAEENETLHQRISELETKIGLLETALVSIPARVTAYDAVEMRRVNDELTWCGVSHMLYEAITQWLVRRGTLTAHTGPLNDWVWEHIVPNPTREWAGPMTDLVSVTTWATPVANMRWEVLALRGIFYDSAGYKPGMYPASLVYGTTTWTNPSTNIYQMREETLTLPDVGSAYRVRIEIARIGMQFRERSISGGGGQDVGPNGILIEYEQYDRARVMYVNPPIKDWLQPQIPVMDTNESTYGFPSLPSYRAIIGEYIAPTA